MPDVHIVVGVYKGCIDSVQAFADIGKSNDAKAKLMEELNIEEGMEGESENSVDSFCVPLQ